MENLRNGALILGRRLTAVGGFVRRASARRKARKESESQVLFAIGPHFAGLGKAPAIWGIAIVIPRGFWEGCRITRNKHPMPKATLILLLLVVISASSIHAATIVVNTLDDELNTDGDCSCREALIAANTDQPFDGCPAGSGADTLTFADGLAGGTLRLILTQGQLAVLQIESSLTIDGRNVTIDGQGNARMFFLTPGTVTPSTRTLRVEFRNLTLINGRGGAISGSTGAGAGGELIVRDCVIAGGKATGGGAAVGINHILGSTKIENCTIRDNEGAGVICAVTSEITNTRFSGNADVAVVSQLNALNSLMIRDCQITNNGGGILVLPLMSPAQTNAVVTVENCLVSDNGSTNSIQSGGIRVQHASTVLSNVTVSGNQSMGGGAGAFLGSGISTHTITIRRSKFLNNTDHPGGSFGGGGLVLGVSAEIEDTTIAGNRSFTRSPSANVGGGGIGFWGSVLTLRRCTISGNHSEEEGGGLFAGGAATLHMENCTVSGNSSAKAGTAIGSAFLRAATLINNTIAFNYGPATAGPVTVSLRTATGTNHTLANNIIASNTVGEGGAQLSTLTAFLGGKNLIGSGSTSLAGNDLVGANPDLLPLADNGGFTQTHLPGSNSAAFDAGDNSFAQPLGTDQRGNERIQGPAADIGSVESAGVPPKPPWIGDSVWEDANANGLRDAKERGLHAVEIRLWQDKNANGLIDDDPDPFRTRQTDGTGRYEFAELPPGRYLVDVKMDPAVLRNNPFLTTAKAVHAVNLGPSGQFADADFGFQARAGGIEGLAWKDCAANGVKEPAEFPLAGVPLTLFRDKNANRKLDEGERLGGTLTKPTGEFSFPGLATDRYLVMLDNSALPPSMARSTVGNPVTVDVEGGQVQDTGLLARTNTVRFGYFHASIRGTLRFDTDGNGSPDPSSDEPLAGVEMRLHYDDNINGTCDPGDPVIAVDSTAADGSYYFDELPPEGFYIVVVNQATLPPKANTLVSGTLPIIRRPVDFQQNCNQIAATLLYRDSGAAGASISDFAWRDSDADGAQDPGEPGVAGLRVRLLDGVGTNVLATVFTDAAGLYEFKGLAAGEYRVAFGPTLTAPGITARDLGGDDTRDSDPDPSTGITDRITLAVGERNTTVDAGLTGAGTEPISAPPMLPSPTLAGEDRVRLAFMGSLGTLYRLQLTENLSPPAWRSIGPAVRGRDAEAVLEAELPEARAGFLRIVGWQE